MKHPFVLALGATFAIVVGLAGMSYSRAVDQELVGAADVSLEQQQATLTQQQAELAQKQAELAQKQAEIDQKLGKQSGSTDAQVSTVAWQKHDPGMAQVKSTDKKVVMLQFFATWCGYCRKMDQEVFTNPAVLSELNQYFVPVRVTESSSDPVTYKGETTTEKDLTLKYGVRGFPTIVFVSSEGEELYRIPGYIGPDEMQKILHEIGTKV